MTTYEPFTRAAAHQQHLDEIDAYQDQANALLEKLNQSHWFYYRQQLYTRLQFYDYLYNDSGVFTLWNAQMSKAQDKRTVQIQLAEGWPEMIRQAEVEWVDHILGQPYEED